MPMMKVSINDITLPMQQEICEILNKGNEVHIKREKDNIAIIELKRKCISKNPISK